MTNGVSSLSRWPQHTNAVWPTKLACSIEMLLSPAGVWSLIAQFAITLYNDQKLHGAERAITENHMTQSSRLCAGASDGCACLRAMSTESTAEKNERRKHKKIWIPFRNCHCLPYCDCRHLKSTKATTTNIPCAVCANFFISLFLSFIYLFELRFICSNACASDNVSFISLLIEMKLEENTKKKHRKIVAWACISLQSQFNRKNNSSSDSANAYSLSVFLANYSRSIEQLLNGSSTRCAMRLRVPQRQFCLVFSPHNVVTSRIASRTRAHKHTESRIKR